MNPLRQAFSQARSSRLMRVAIILWTLWSLYALAMAAMTAYFALTSDSSLIWGVLALLASIPLAGLILWFVAGCIRWIISPTS